MIKSLTAIDSNVVHCDVEPNQIKSHLLFVIDFDGNLCDVKRSKAFQNK